MQKKFDENYYYGGVYSNYDKFLNWEKVAKDLLQRYKFKSFLDIGCGCGNLVKEIKRQKKNLDVYGVDISEFAVKKANFPFVFLAECEKLPFENDYFEVVYILGTFSYLPAISNIKQAIQEAYRVSKRIVVFEDVYTVPGLKSDDYDPCRKHFYDREKWVMYWKKYTKYKSINTSEFKGVGRYYDMIEIYKNNF